MSETTARPLPTPGVDHPEGRYRLTGLMATGNCLLAHLTNVTESAGSYIDTRQTLHKFLGQAIPLHTQLGVFRGELMDCEHVKIGVPVPPGLPDDHILVDDPTAVKLTFRIPLKLSKLVGDYFAANYDEDGDGADADLPIFIPRVITIGDDDPDMLRTIDWLRKRGFSV